MLARLFLMGFIVTLCERPGSASKKPAAASYGTGAPNGVSGYFSVIATLWPRQGLLCGLGSVDDQNFARRGGGLHAGQASVRMAPLSADGPGSSRAHRYVPGGWEAAAPGGMTAVRATPHRRILAFSSDVIFR